MQCLKVYTDGAYSSKRNQGGWSFIVIDNDEIIYKKFAGVLNTTNNRMEIEAVLQALEYLKKYECTVSIYSDSMYVIGTLTKNWDKNTNLDLWERFNSYDLSKVSFIHVKGHDTNQYNNICDTLAVLGSHANILSD